MYLCRVSLFASLLVSYTILSTEAFQTTAHAQQPSQAGQAQVTSEASTKADPELKYILQNWEKAGDFTKKLEGRHKRYIYDYVFFVEKWSEGEFYYEAPDKGRIDLGAPAKFKEGQTVTRKVKGVEKPFAVQQDKEERWICDGTQVYSIDQERKEYQVLPIPVENRGQNIVDGPLPFLFGISEEKVRMRYNVTLFRPNLGGQHDLQQGRIHLKVKPLWQQDAANWQEAEVMLDAKSYLPTAIRLIHPGANAETVYVFYDMKRNASRGVFQFWQGSPFDPNLRGFKRLTSTAKAETELTPK